MEVYKIIKTGIDVSKIMEQINSRNDWEKVSDIKDIYVQEKYYLHILPLNLGLCTFGEPIYDSDIIQETPWKYEYSEILKWLDEMGFQGRVRRCSFFKIPPGGHLGMHNEYSRYYQNKDRWHFCVQGKYRYFVENEVFEVEAGTFFWFDNKKDHAVINIGDEDRITFVWDSDMVENDLYVGDIRHYIESN